MNAAEISGDRRPEFQNPSTDGFIADFQSSFRQQILDVPIAHGEPKVEPDGMPDDVRRKAVMGVGDAFHRPP
jgi:hypothetical protein